VKGAAGEGAHASLAPRPVPLLTPELPGTGGSLRVSEADFRVEELPLYPASGEGDHLFATVEKIGRTTQEVARELGAALGVNEREMGSAGLKDKRAVAVQRFSLPLPRGAAGPRAGERAAEFTRRALEAAGPGWRVLAAERHGNKLRPGHLAGNRFRIVARGCVEDALPRARAVLSRLRETGAANLFGPQRFGRRGDNAQLGAALLARDPAARQAARDRFLRRLALSALQAELFNRCLAARLGDGLFSRAIAGDVLRKRDSGGLFVGEDPAAETLRVEAGEIDPAGPLPGHSIFAARGEALAREQAVLAETGIDPRSFAAGGGEMEGARRPYRIAAEADVEEEPAEAAAGPAKALVFTFVLPPGSYATCILREAMKSTAAELED
jgi:tRNA pseudouridine13 synthase